MNFMVEPRFLDVHSVEKKLKMGSLMVPMINELMWKLKPIPLSATALVLAATHSVDEIKIKNTQEEMIKKSEELLEDEDYQCTLENRDDDEDASKSEEESEKLLEETIKLGHT